MNTINSVRAWRVVAEELSRENNSQKITQLAFELDQALDEQEIKKPYVGQEPAQKGVA